LAGADSRKSGLPVLAHHHLGPDNYLWTDEFFGVEEQNSLDGYAFIRQTIAAVFSPGVHVQSLRLTDFRCFDELELRFDRQSSLEGRWTCIAGINGAGKSSILQASVWCC
jgi:hypothetical protein